jgi:two-component system cell cycle response regulator
MATCRQGDIVSRIGGEEFLVLLPHCSIRDAMHKAENIRSMIEMARPAGLKVTASIGIASLNKHHDADFEKLYKAADNAVYHSKEGGRNRVTADPQSIESSELKRVSNN